MATWWNKMNRFAVCIAFVLSIALLSACHHHAGSYSDVVRPNSLLDSSSERVKFGLGDDASVIGELSSWIDGDQPSSAELKCSGQNPICAEAELVLAQYGVSFEITPAVRRGANEVVLFYDRVVTRDCATGPGKRRPKLGCSTSANIVQMVEDHRQFVNPAYQDPKDAESAVKVYKKYLKCKKSGCKKDKHKGKKGKSCGSCGD